MRPTAKSLLLDLLSTVGRGSVPVRALVRAGACRSSGQAFDRFLRRGRPAFVPSVGLGAREAIDLIHSAGGVAALAHPFLSIGVDQPGGLDAFVARLAHAGLDGLELEHPSHTAPQRKRLRRLLRKHELVATGGSDFHGEERPEVEIGRGRGNVAVGRETYEAILLRREQIRAGA